MALLLLPVLPSNRFQPVLKVISALPSDEELDELRTERTRAFVFSNPSNPTGAIYSREVERIARWCHRNGLFLISDEVYRRIWFDAPPASALEIEDASDAIVVIDSLSKTWSACGLRLGALISRNLELMEKLNDLGRHDLDLSLLHNTLV